MYHNYDSRVALLSGITGGIAKYFLQIHTPFLVNLLGAVFTAMLCGAAGVAGKELYNHLKKHFKKK